MDARLRLTFFCGSCLGLAVGFAAGHVSVWQRVAHSPSSGLSFNDPEPGYSASLGVSGFDFPAEISTPQIEAATRIPVPGGAVVLNDPDLGDETVHAEVLVEIPSLVSEAVSPTLQPVEPLTPPHAFLASQAKPLATPTTPNLEGSPPEPATTQQAQAVSSEPSQLDPEVAEMLRDEMQGVSDQQREIWADALQGMSPADAAGVITMWKKFGQKSAGPRHLSSPPPLFDASHPEDTPTPLGHPGTLHHLLSPPVIEEGLGVRIAQHNQANRETCGYLDMIPILKEVAFDQVQNGQHVEVVGYRLKIEPGRIVETGNPSHVAVQRECFFAVQLPTGEERYTRVGRLVLDAERRLCIDLGDRDLPITPEVKLPEGATRFLVQNGELRVAIEGRDEPTSVGALQVAEFFDASRLLPMGSSLYGATIASGKPKMVAAELVFESLEYPVIDQQSMTAGTIRTDTLPMVSKPRE